MLQQQTKLLLKVLLFIQIAPLHHKKECKMAPLPLLKREDIGLVVNLDCQVLDQLAILVNSVQFWLQKNNSKEVLLEQ